MKIIRKALNKDTGGIQNVLQKAHYYNKRKGFVFPASRISQEKIRSLQSENEYYVMIIKNQIVGTVCLKNRGSRWEIVHLAILPGFQKKGLGNKMLKFAENRLLDRNVKFAYLQTHKGHLKLRHYYIKRGYRIIRSSTLQWILFRKTLL